MELGVAIKMDKWCRKMGTEHEDEKATHAQTFFTRMVDDLVEYSEYDSELASGLKYLDRQAQEKGISFYDMVYNLLYKHDVDVKAKQWLEDKND